MNELALFAGAGGGILGGHILGWRTVCAVEWDPYAIAVLCARQNDGVLPPFPIWDDVRTFDGRPWRGRVDVVSGGFPCTDISAAGKGAGIGGEASGLWSEMARVVDEVRPRFVFVENSPLLARRGLALVLRDLASMGYNARWCVLGADDAGAPHRRKRIWVMAWSHGHPVRFASDCDPCECCDEPWCPSCGDHFADCECPGPTQDDEYDYDATGQWASPRALADANGSGQPADQGRGESSGAPEAWNDSGRCCADVADTEGQRGWTGLRQDGPQRDGDQPADGGGDVPDAQEPGLEGPVAAGDSCAGGCAAEPGQGRRDCDWWLTEPELGRVANGVAHRVDRLKCIGNGQVPRVAALAWEILTGNGGGG